MASELKINKNETVYNFFTISHEEAEIQFEVDKEGIIDINKEFIKGIKAGVVEITIIATLDNMFAQTKFKVYVYESGYYYSILPIADCTIDNNHLTMQSTSCQFSLTIYNNLGQKVDNSKFTYVPSNDALLTYQFSVFRLASSCDCSIRIVYEEYNLTVEINVFALNQ